MIIFFYKKIINKVLKLYFFVILGFYYYFIRKYFGIKFVFIIFLLNKIIFLKCIYNLYVMCKKNLNFNVIKYLKVFRIM